MGWASQSGRAVTNPGSPRAFGTCDRCGIWYNLHKLKWQREWAGTQLVNRGWLVCDGCLDEPNPQLKARLMPPDPVPVRNPRPELWLLPGYMDTALSTEPSPRPWDRPLSPRVNDHRQPMVTERGQLIQGEPTGPPKPIMPTPGPSPQMTVPAPPWTSPWYPNDGNPPPMEIPD